MRSGVFRMLLFALLASTWASADTPGSCSSVPSCTDGSVPTCAADVTCIVMLQRSGNAVNMYVNGTQATAFCVSPYDQYGNRKQVIWQVNDANATSFFDVRFAGAAPFTKSSLQGDTANATTAFVQTTSNACYQFAITDCPVASGSACGYNDPKVVISNGLSLIRKHPTHKHRTDAAGAPNP